MKSFCLYLLTTILFCSLNTNAQFSVGLTAEGTKIITDRNNPSVLMPITGLGVVVGYSPIHRLQLEGRGGYDLLLSEYRGTNLSLNLLYYVYKPIYLIGGYSFHSNEGSSDEGISSGQVNLIIAGIGVNIGELASLEALYGKTTRKEPWIYYLDQITWNSKVTYLEGIFKIILKLKSSL